MNGLISLPRLHEVSPLMLMMQDKHACTTKTKKKLSFIYITYNQPHHFALVMRGITIIL